MVEPKAEGGILPYGVSNGLGLAVMVPASDSGVSGPTVSTAVVVEVLPFFVKSPILLQKTAGRSDLARLKEKSVQRNDGE